MQFFHKDVIISYNCFLVQKVSHRGNLELRSDRLTFVYSSGEQDKDADVKYTDITEMNVETRFAHAMNNLEVHTADQTFHFSGLYEAQSVKELITLLQNTITEIKPSYGFTATGKNTVQFQELDKPILLHSVSLPASLSDTMTRIESKECFNEYLTSVGNEDVSISDWVQKDGYKERIIDYNKLVVLPVLGKNLIKVSECHRLFKIGNKYAIDVFSDLGKTPYADCFDPRVQLHFEENGDKVDFLVKFEMLWSSEPFVKSIIMTKTTTETRDGYIVFGNQLVRELGGSVDEGPAKSEGEEAQSDDFSKTRMIYKISIISLIVFLLLSYLYKYTKGNPNITFSNLIFSTFTLALFFVFLLFF